MKDITLEKLHETIDNIMDDEMYDYTNIDIADNVASKLLDYQVLHVHNLLFALKRNNIVIDGSDTGTGKTYSAIACCKQLNLKPFIICPKTIMSSWKLICDVFNVSPASIVNYETIRNCNEYNNLIEKKRIASKYISYNESKEEYTWNIPKNVIIIFDEVHKCKNKKSLNGQMLLSIKNVNHALLLSATLADTIESFHIYGYLLGFYKSMKQANNWINGIMKEDSNSNRTLSTIYKKIYPNYGSRMLIQELGDKFPKSQIIATCYDTDYVDDINKQYKKIVKREKLLKTEENKAMLLQEITKARMKIELNKVNIFKELASDYIKSGYSVVIFVNYIETLKKLSTELECKNLLYGDIPDNERDIIINNFNKNKIRMLICISTVGGTGVNLHDTNGNYPRVSLISPSFSSITLIQVLGRLTRAGAKSKSLQRIIFCANTCEEMICNNISKKINFTKSINNSIIADIDLNINFDKKKK